MSQAAPDFSPYGFVATQLLGRNLAAGRSTWLATGLSDGVEVVIKRFSFAASDATWESLRDHEREIAVLRELHHPGIPRFLQAFETPDGFCLVQSRVTGRPLGERRSFALDELLDIARKVLKILIYLQDRMPPVIHRDLKPENILHDERGRVWLVDFGLARAQHDTTSTLAVGTPGFMSPEQMLGRALGPAADLYGLGATLIACLTGRRGAELGDLVDATFHFDLDRLPELPDGIREWLSLLVRPAAADRYPNAAAALRALALAERGASVPRSVEPVQEQQPIAAAPPHRGSLWISVSLLSGLGLPLIIFFVGEDLIQSALTEAVSQVEATTVPVRTPQTSLSLRQAAGDPLAAPSPRELPEVCTGPLAIANRTFSLSATEEPLIAKPGCDLSLTDVAIEADGTALELVDGARVHLTRVTLTSKGSTPPLVVSGFASTLEADASTFQSNRAPAIEIREGTASLRGGRLTTQGRVALRVMEDGLVKLDGSTLNGGISDRRSGGKSGGYVLGVDPETDKATQKALRDDHYQVGACAGWQACVEDNGYFGTLELQIVGRLTKGVLDSVKVIDGTNGRVSRELRDCLVKAALESPAPTTGPRGGVGPAPDELPLAYRGCGITGQINGGSRMLNIHRFFFVAAESPDNARKMRAVFR